jgi:hypothetical protein
MKRFAASFSSNTQYPLRGLWYDNQRIAQASINEARRRKNGIKEVVEKEGKERVSSGQDICQ